jgi:3-dehydroquinate synthase
LPYNDWIKRNIAIKSKIVARDEATRQASAHYLTSVTQWSRDRARAIIATFFTRSAEPELSPRAVSIRRAGLAPNQRDAIVDVLRQFELPTKLPKDFPCEKVFEALQFDKKFEGGKVRFVVTPRIGAAHLANDVSRDDIREAVKQL